MAGVCLGKELDGCGLNFFYCSCSLRKRKGGYSSSGRGGGEKQSKGLRHFSQLVCEKVREKGITSYNEVMPIFVAMATTIQTRALACKTCKFVKSNFLENKASYGCIF